LLLYFGTSPKTMQETSIQSFARLISEFALEYRTAKERVESQRKKKHHREERIRKRGKTILEVCTSNFANFLQYVTCVLTLILFGSLRAFGIYLSRYLDQETAKLPFRSSSQAATCYTSLTTQR